MEVATLAVIEVMARPWIEAIAVLTAIAVLIGDIPVIEAMVTGMVVAAVVLEVHLMIVTPQKEPAMEVNVKKEEGMTLAAVVEDMAAVTEVMEGQIAVTPLLIGVMALPLIVLEQEAMVEGHKLIGRTRQVHILEAVTGDEVRNCDPECSEDDRSCLPYRIIDFSQCLL